MPIRSLRSIRDKWKSSGSVNTKPRSERTSKVRPQTLRLIVQEAKKNPRVTSSDLQATLQVAVIDIATKTIRLYLKKFELTAKATKKNHT